MADAVVKFTIHTIATRAVNAFKAALGIKSPSRMMIKAAHAHRKQQWEPPQPLPWWAARHPLDRWESKTKKRNARLMRRQLRREMGETRCRA
jgi:hypothetical protein